MNSFPESVEARARQLFAEQQTRNFIRTDRLFAVLMAAQWLAGILAALWISPRTWVGPQSGTNPHVWYALFLGGMISALPICLALFQPGKRLTRYAIATGQMLTSALLIHLTGGRLETHFHIFGSLAFLAFYRDWTVLVPATVVVAADHFVRGVYFPQSVFGVATASSWRWIEHAAWVAFEDLFLVIACLRGTREMRQISLQTAQLEAGKADVEAQVLARTAQLRQANEELQTLTTRLRASNRELEEFASVASHDLQEPLRKIQAFGDRLKSVAGPALDEKGSDYLERMLSAATRMRTLINDLLTFSRITTRVQPSVPVDLAQITSEVLGDLEVRIAQSEARVEVGPMETVLADPLQMRQLLQNLIANALKFHRPGVPPVVRVSASVTDSPAGVFPSAADGSPKENQGVSSGWCRLQVEDEGIGFDEKYLDRIFGVFQRLHGRGEYEGTGVGLAICRKIAERHGGNITARSTPGVGTTFEVFLPLAPSGEPASIDKQEVPVHV